MQTLFMARKKCFIFLSLFFFLPVLLSAQTDSLAYAPGFNFRQGIYLNYQQFKENRPVPRSKIVCHFDSTRRDFIQLETAARTLSYTDSSGKVIEISSENIWGYCENYDVYIRYNNAFAKFYRIGCICYFTINILDMYQHTGNPSPVKSVSENPAGEFILDTKTGAVLEFVLPNFESILKRDPELYSQFMGLRRGNRKAYMLEYLIKYNQRNLLYFQK